MYVDECVEAVLRLMVSDFSGPVNIGSEEMVSLNHLAGLAIKISGKDIQIENLAGDGFLQKYGFKCPLGVSGRNSDNQLYREKIGWESFKKLEEGLRTTYEWIAQQVAAKAASSS